ncbi:MAG TPA: M28 family peptidase [Caulobacteraceae bacterium]|jgi:Zn-dependent M28 family amino/carboxypeptidase
MRAALATVLAALALTAAAAPPASAPPSPISAARIRQDVRVLSSDAFEGRGPGQPAEHKTLDYLIAQFKAAGLQPGGPNGAWLQNVPLTQFDRSARVDASLTLPHTHAATPLLIDRDITVASHQVGRTHIDHAPIVFVGYGVNVPGWNSFDGADLHGKVALILANDPDFEATPRDPAYGKFGGKAMVYPGRFGAKVAAAQAAGALAVFVIHEDGAASYPWRQVANGDRIASMEIASPNGAQKNATTSTVGVNGWIQRDVAIRLLHSAGLDFARLKHAARDPNFKPIELKGATLSLDFDVASHPVISHNVIARLPGAAHPDETVIYGAHWDANGKGAPVNGDDIRNGAVDNATGTAEMVEVARAFAHGPRPARSLVFIAYTSEEKGLLGSDYYAAHPVWPLNKTVAVINLDPHVMLGRARNLESIGFGRVSLEDDVAQAAAAEHLALTPEPHPEAGWYFRSDQYSFAKRGVPAVTFRIGRDLYAGGLKAGTARAEDYNVKRYHQPGDAFDPAWTFAGSAQEATVAWRVGLKVANATAWPTWKPGAEFAKLRPR